MYARRGGGGRGLRGVGLEFINVGEYAAKYGDINRKNNEQNVTETEIDLWRETQTDTCVRWRDRS